MSRKVKINMTGVESFTRCPEGEWLAKLKKIEMTEIQGSGDDGLKAQFEVIKGAAKGSSVFETFSLGEKALWKLKSFLEAIGVKADGKINLDLDKLEGKICVIDVIHDEFNGKKRAKINDYIKPEDEDDEDEIENEEEDDEEEEDVKPSKSKASSKSSKKSAKKPEPEEDDEDEDEDEDEEEEKPAKKSSSKKKSSASAKKSKKPEPEPEDDDDDDDWEEDDD